MPWWGFLAVLLFPALALAIPAYLLVRFLDWRDRAGRYAEAPLSQEDPE